MKGVELLLAKMVSRGGCSSRKTSNIECRERERNSCPIKSPRGQSVTVDVDLHGHFLKCKQIIR